MGLKLRPLSWLLAMTEYEVGVVDACHVLRYLARKADERGHVIEAEGLRHAAEAVEVELLAENWRKRLKSAV